MQNFVFVCTVLERYVMLPLSRLYLQKEKRVASAMNCVQSVHLFNASMDVCTKTNLV